MAAIWFLVFTVCSGADNSNCHDYVLDEGMSYTDCIDQLPRTLLKNDVFAVACKRGEIEEN